MKKLAIIIVAMVFILCLALAVQADKIDRRTEEATDIVVGKIKHVKSYNVTNKWGDELIMSQVTLKVEKTLKGERHDEVTFAVEGGEVEGIVLRVSTVPLFEEGDAVVLYLKKKDGRFEYLDSEGLAISGKKAKPPKLSCCKIFAKWPNPNVLFYINTNTSDMSDRCVADEITAGADDWNNVSEVNLQYSGRTDGTTINSSDGNNIFFRDGPSGSTIAVTYIWYTRKGGSIIAFDMIIYDSWTYFGPSRCTDPCNTGFYLHPIAAHELGHAIGLDHNRCQSSLMYPYASYCEENLLSPDDTACIQSLYGN